MLKLNELSLALRQRIQKQIDQEDARKRPHQSVGGLAGTQSKPHPSRALDRKLPPRKDRKRSVGIVVTFIPVRSFTTDEDNCGSGAYKSMRDAIAKSLGIDDGDKRIRFEYADPVITQGKPGTQILITAL